jgi:hypothetical protein
MPSMADSDDDSGDGGLSAAEDDANSAFWFDHVDSTVQPCSSDSPPSVVSQDKKHWIEIALVDQENKPVAGQNYRVVVPGGTVVTGSLNSKGRARIDGIDAGSCKITFPDLDKDSWKPQ